MWFIVCNNCTNESISKFDNDTIFYPYREMIYGFAHFTCDFYFFLLLTQRQPLRSTLSLLLLRTGNKKRNEPQKKVKSAIFLVLNFHGLIFTVGHKPEKTRRKSWKSCNFPQSSIILSFKMRENGIHHIVFYNRCQKAARINWKTAKEKISVGWEKKNNSSFCLCWEL